MAADKPAGGQGRKARRAQPQLMGKLVRVVAPFADTSLQGFVDRIIGDEAVGWAFDPHRPQRRVLVVVRLGGRVVSEALADLPRRDLEEAGKGDGRCGFRLKLPSNLDPEIRAGLRIEAVAGMRRRRLKEAKRFKWELANPQKQSADKLESSGPNVGYLERCVEGRLRGWAVDPNNPETPAAVDLFDGEFFLGCVTADINRPRLRDGGAPFGARGFEFTLPEGRAISPDNLRARISRTRYDLRRNRTFPGDGAARAEAQRNQRAERSPAGVQATVVRTVGLVVLSEGDDVELVEATLASWRAQGWTDTMAAVVAGGGAALPKFEATTVLARDDDTGLNRWMKACQTVVFLSAGQRAAPHLAATLAETPATHDVLVWSHNADDWGAELPMHARLGAAIGGLAVRTTVLNGELVLKGGSEGIAAFIADSALRGLSWDVVREPLASGRLAVATPPPPTGPPRRLTLAVWSGWETGAPPALASLLADCAGFDTEVLVPASSPLAAGRALDLGPAPGRSLTARLVDLPVHNGRNGVLAAFGRAATGQVVLFCEGHVTTEPRGLRAAALWAMEPGVGAVTITLIHGTARLQGLGLKADGAVGAAIADIDTPENRPIFAAPSAFLAVSRAALAQVDGFDPACEGPGEVDLAQRLRAAGRTSLVLGDRRAEALAGAVEPWLPPLDGART